MTSKAIFFDRDETLIHDSHYMYKKEQLHFIDGVFEVLNEVQNKGYLIFIVTNQSGIGRGYFTEEQMHEFHSHMLAGFTEQGIKIEEVAFCPHDPKENCDCRKPKPKLLDDLCAKYNLDASKCFMVGDRITDAKSGEAAGMTSVTLNCDYKNNITKLSELLNYLE